MNTNIPIIIRIRLCVNMNSIKYKCSLLLGNIQPIIQPIIQFKLNNDQIVEQIKLWICIV